MQLCENTVLQLSLGLRKLKQTHIGLSIISQFFVHIKQKIAYYSGKMTSIRIIYVLWIILDNSAITDTLTAPVQLLVLS